MEGEDVLDDPRLTWTRRLDAYEYEPLKSSSSIRILTIKPDKDFDAPVEASIKSIDLDLDSAPYVALSHAWGNPVLSRVLICDRKRVAITGRVELALRKIRWRALEKEYQHWSTIWIDAICIDQKSNVEAQVEKSQQVAMMHRIFGTASEVIVDLGRAGRLTHMLPQSADEVDALAAALGLDEGLSDLYSSIARIALHDDQAQGTVMAQSLAAIGKLFQREWFTRVWTFQEFALARDARFIIADKVVKREYLERLMNVVSPGGGVPARNMPLQIISLLGPGVVTGRQKIILARRLRQRLAKEPSWRYYLTVAGSIASIFDSSDRRDFIYAVHALCRVTNETFPVDYTESTSDLSRRAARFILNELSNNRFLHSVAGIIDNYGTADSPHSSWGIRLGSPMRGAAEGSKHILAGDVLPYAAGGDQTDPLVLCSCSDHRHCIQANICLKDTIVAVSEPMFCQDLNDERFSHLLKVKVDHTKCWLPHTQIMVTWIERAALPVFRQCSQHQDADFNSEVLWKTFLHDREASGTHRLPKDFMVRVRPVLKAWDALRAAYKVLGYDPDGQETYDAAIQHTLQWFDYADVSEKYEGQSPENVARFREMKSEIPPFGTQGFRLDSFSWGRTLDQRICVTQGGRVGSVHEMSRVGDEIMVFDGCSMPFTVRQDGAQYRLIAAAYVEGLMYGEACEGSVQWEEVHLV